MEVDQITSFLVEASRTDLPQTVRQLLDDLGRRAGEVKLAPAGGYIHVADPALLQEIASLRNVKEFVAATVGDQVLILKPGAKLAQLEKALKKSGYFAKTERVL